jgi:hypothetical protein
MLAEVPEQISVARELLFQPDAIFRAEALEDPLAGGSVRAVHKPTVPRRSPCAVRQALQPCPADDAVSVLPLDVRCEAAKAHPVAADCQIAESAGLRARPRSRPCRHSAVVVLPVVLP